MEQRTQEILRILPVEFDIRWEDRDANLDFLDKKLSNNPDVDIVILPEMFTTGFSMVPALLAETMEGISVSWMKEKGRQINAAICGSLIIEESGNYYNRFVFTTPEGDLYTYDKCHLFSFAGEDEAYQKGKERTVFQYRGWRIMPQICYDLRFPVWSRNDLDYDLLIYVANWPQMRIAAWDTLLRARAIENLAYVAAVNRIGKDGNDLPYIGHSAVIGPDGISLENSNSVYEIERSVMSIFRNKFRFLNDRDTFRIAT